MSYQVHKDFEKDCGYISVEKHSELIVEYLQIGRMPGNMMLSPEEFAPKPLPSAF